MNKFQAARYITEFAKENVAKEDLDHFIVVTEVDISSLHEGNFASFKIRPSDFFACIKNGDKQMKSIYMFL